MERGKGGVGRRQTQRKKKKSLKAAREKRQTPYEETANGLVVHL